MESNDTIFIGNEDFVNEAHQLMDYCFEQILEIIQKLDGMKEEYYPVLFESCISSGNILIGNCNLSNAKVNAFVNKMFKMSDKYLVENNKKTGAVQLSRNQINLTYESFRKKKE